MRQILRTIHDKLQEIPFTEGDSETIRRPDERYVKQQRPSVIFYTIDILKFINTLILQVQNEVHLIRLLFCQKEVGIFDSYNPAHQAKLHEIR